MGDEERSLILEKLEEFERIIWKGDNGESIVARLQKLEMRQSTMLKAMLGLMILAAPGLVTLLALGIRTWLNGVGG